MTVRARLTAIYAAAMLATLVVAGGVLWWQLREALRTSLDRDLETRAGVALQALENQGQAGLQESDAAIPPGVFVFIVDPSGAVVDATAGTPAGVQPPAAGFTTAEVAIGPATYALHAVAGDGGVRVVAGSSLAAIAATLDRLTRLLFGVGALAAAASLGGGWWLAGRALRPVAVLTTEASRFGAADPDRRLPVPRQRDELQLLALTLNGMLDRVAEALRRQGAFVAAASHDLRTPIAALQAELDLAADDRTPVAELRDAVRAAHADVVRLGELATALLDLAAADAGGRALVRGPVRADDLVGAVARRAEPLARPRGTQIRHAAPARVVRVDRVRIEQAAANLVANAIAYGPPGSVVEIVGRIDDVAAAEGAETHAVLVVEVLDRGPGMPPGQADSLFLPFHRGPDAPGPGRGLGLATAAAAVRAHHGTIGFEPREGGGTRFWLRVPA